MMRRPSVTGTFTLAALSLGTLVGCGTGEGNTDGAAPSSGTKTHRPADDLARRLLTTADLKGYEVEKPDAKHAIAKDQQSLKVDKPACAQAAYAMNDLPIGDPRATATREVNEDDHQGMETSVTVSVYAPGEAEAAMAGLAEAVRSCDGGFTAKGTGTNPYDSVRAEADPGYGDESLAFAANYEVQGVNHTFRTQAARFGDRVVLYFAYDGDAFLSSAPGDARIPEAIVEAQNAKLTG
ncbi:hypothetical protein [Streptomyces sp. NPDC048845]